MCDKHYAFYQLGLQITTEMIAILLFFECLEDMYMQWLTPISLYSVELRIHMDMVFKSRLDFLVGLG